ncbi:MAG TPA: efflux RND transporter periplasmic adaptor subunit [Kiritimatiellia bacterium]|mgnify:FL=1|nr:efflux RND transporter periplasmic adaptor subunit [Kiritimatiellia bacterium]HRX05536.1 efflux RND transporter periplasmic adaptor subunit [Kiritimatiellia bacterium]
MQKNGKKRWAWLGILILAGAGAWWWRGGGASGGGETGYRTMVLERGEIVQTVTANGALSAVQTVDVGSEVSGKITELLADYNSTVTNGQVLARLDASTYERQLEQAQAELESSKASLKLAEANYRRAQELRAQDLVSQADYDQTEASLAQARASLRLREAGLSKVEVDLEKTTIFSPMDGVVISRAVDVGQTVAASLNAPVLFTLAQDLRQMRIEAQISEADVGGVTEGQRVTFTVDAYPARTFTGVVSQVRFEPVTVQNVVNYIAVVDVDNADLKLRPGMTANAAVETARLENVLRLPNAALRFRPDETDAVAEAEPDFGPPPEEGGGPPPDGMGPPPGTKEPRPAKRSGGRGREAPENMRSVYVLGDDGALREVRVPTGITDGSWTEALGGLREGVRVVTGRLAAGEEAQPAANGRSPFMPGPPQRRWH